jgi:hypothetical protein
VAVLPRRDKLQRLVDRDDFAHQASIRDLEDRIVGPKRSNRIFCSRSDAGSAGPRHLVSGLMKSMLFQLPVSGPVSDSPSPTTA